MKQDESKRAFERLKAIFPGGVNSPVRAFKSVSSDPFIVSRGQGAYLYDVDGNRYVDYVCSWGPLVLGHANALIVEALRTQAEKGVSYGACCELEAELGEFIRVLMPSLEMLRFVNSGTEAAMSVMRLARAFTGRNKILKFSGGYHGHVDSLLVQAGSGVATLGLPDSAGVSASSTGDTLTADFNDLASVADVFAHFPEEVAAIIVEPIMGNAGLIKPISGFLEGLRRITQEHRSLLIFDEVMTGFRVHLGGAQKLFNVKPDLSMLGKVIGGGLPVGAFGGRKEIMSMLAPLGPVYQAGTLSGNPLAMAAGLATLKEWARPGVFDEVQETTRILVQAFQEISRSRGISLTAEAAGTMFGYFFKEGQVRNYSEAKQSDLVRFRKFFHLMLESGVYFAPSQFEAGFLSVGHSGEPVDRTLDALNAAFKEL